MSLLFEYIYWNTPIVRFERRVYFTALKTRLNLITFEHIDTKQALLAVIHVGVLAIQCNCALSSFTAGSSPQMVQARPLCILPALFLLLNNRVQVCVIHLF